MYAEDISVLDTIQFVQIRRSTNAATDKENEDEDEKNLRDIAGERTDINKYSIYNLQFSILCVRAESQWPDTALPIRRPGKAESY